MGRWFAAVLWLCVVATTSWPVLSVAKKPIPAARDANQISFFISDFDGSFAHNLGHYIVRLALFPGMPGLGGYSNLPQVVEVPTNDWEGNVGPRIRDLLGHYNQGHFVPSAALQEITLSNGQKIIPGYYFRDHVDVFREFLPTGSPQDGFLYRRLLEKLEKNEPFLLEAAAFVAAAYSEEFQDRVSGAILTMRGHSSEEMQFAMHKLRDHFKWGTVDWAREAYINLKNPEFSEYAASKSRFVREFFNSLTQRMMTNKETPHFMVVLENDRHQLTELYKTMAALSNNGVFSNPVVPILVNLVEPEVFARPGGLNWDRSALETPEKMFRVTIFWGNKVEETNNLARVFELTLGQTPQEALKTYKQKKNHLWCRDLLTGGRP